MLAFARRLAVALSLLLAALASGAPAASQEAAVTPKMRAQAERLIAEALADDTGYRVVESLTTEVGPRLAGTQAEARARDWAVAKLKDLGFKNVRIEPFEVSVWERGAETAEITAPFPQKLVVTALGGSPSTPPGGVEGPVARYPSLEALAAAAPADIAGKIVFVDEPMTRTQDGSGYGVAVRKRYDTPFDVAAAGALGVLIRSVGTSSHRFPHTGSMLSGREEAPVPAAALSGPDADQLARALARDEAVRVRLTLEPKSGGTARSGNVIAEIPGRSKPEEIVLIGAHLDSWDLGTGAVDDGAGVGIVVGAAHTIRETLRRPPRRTVRIVLFGSEEVGLVGAKAYAQQHAEELALHILAAESDFGASTVWRFDGRVGEDKRPAMDEIAAVLAPLGVAPGENEARGGPDLAFLRAAGVPIAGPVQNGWDYFDLHHTPDDTFDKIDPAELAQNVAVYAALAYLAAETRATFRAAPLPEETGAAAASAP